MHSIELLLDSATDDAVRGQWRRLADAGLPSQARHSGASNAPHVTLVAAETLTDAHDAELEDLFQALPLRVSFGGLVVFGRPPRGLVLARGIAVSEAILRLQRRVHELASGTPALAPHGVASHGLPGDWTPHVTLGSRLTPEELARAVEVLGEEPDPATGSFVAARRWDSTAKSITALGGARGDAATG